MGNQNNPPIDMNHWLYRIVALIIDSLIIAIPVYIIYYFVFLSLLFSGAFFFVYYGTWLLFPFLLGIIEVLYFVILDVSWGGTVGKRVMGLQVQMENGGKVDFGKAFIRNISKIYWPFLLLDWIIGLVTPGPDRRQKFSDRYAGTTVISVRQAFAGMQSTPPPPPPPPA
jgi:uncharacterized RDD family membrane protein YckC